MSIPVGRLWPFLRALAVMAAAAVGSCSVASSIGGMTPEETGIRVGIGVFLLVGAWFLYRGWFIAR